MACCKSSDKTVNTVFLFIFNCSVNLNWVCVVSKKTMCFGLDHRTCCRHLFQIFNFISAGSSNRAGRRVGGGGMMGCPFACYFVHFVQEINLSFTTFNMAFCHWLELLSDYCSQKSLLHLQHQMKHRMHFQGGMRSVFWIMKLWLTLTEWVAVHGAVFWAHYTKANHCKDSLFHYQFRELMQSKIINTITSCICNKTLIQALYIHAGSDIYY